jgi:DNA/RNA-binding domain of Phe-tRNA-synthetase-like protein
VRDLLRGHGYKPAGRGKPASEFLAGAAARGEFPRINNVVDINNLVSLETGWPISVIDLDRAGDALELRHGRPDERFAFNAAGPEIDVAGLLCVARVGGEAIANPVKDSMATKLTPDTSRVLAVLYTSRSVATPDEVRAASRRFGDLLERHAGATRIEIGLVEG